MSFFVVDTDVTFARIIALIPGGVKDTDYLTLTRQKHPGTMVSGVLKYFESQNVLV